jgi:hypothetical protein
MASDDDLPSKKGLPSRVEQIVSLEHQADELDKRSDDLR